MPALVRGEKFEARTQPHFERPDERRRDFGSREVHSIRGSNPLPDLILRGEKICDHARQQEEYAGGYPAAAQSTAQTSAQ